MQHAPRPIAEQGTAKAAAFMIVMDSQLPKDDGRDRFGHVAAEAAWRRRCLDAAGCEGIVTDNLPGITGHEEARCVGGLVFERAALQLLVKGCHAGDKFSDPMMFGQRFGNADRQA